MQTANRRPLPYLAQLFDLMLIQLSNWRWSWRGMVLTGMLAPVMSMVALGTFGRASGPQALEYILVGNLVLALMFGTTHQVSGNFAFMRRGGMLGFFASLPIQRSALVLATVLAFFLLSLPSVLVTLLLGAVYLQVPLTWTPWLLVVLPLTTVALSSLGALIGTRARTPEEANSISLLTTMALMGIGPVVIPPERLPDFLLVLGRFSPATYAAAALRQALIGPVTGELLLDLVVLAGVSVVVLTSVSRAMDWRQV